MNDVMNLYGADVVAHDNGSVDVTGTSADFAARSLIRGKGVANDWIATF